MERETTRVLTRPTYPAAGDIGMVDYISKMISGLHWPEYAEKLDKKVYPGLAELLPMIKNIDVSGAPARANPRAVLERLTTPRTQPPETVLPRNLRLPAMARGRAEP